MVVFQTSQTKLNQNISSALNQSGLGRCLFFGLNLLRAANDVSRLNEALVKAMPFRNPA